MQVMTLTASLKAFTGWIHRTISHEQLRATVSIDFCLASKGRYHPQSGP